KVEVIDTNTNTVTTTLTVGDVPVSIEQDSNGAIWVLCAGRPSYAAPETSGSLVKIENDQVTSTLNFDGTTNHPSHLAIHNNTLLYNLNGKIPRSKTLS
ncbi:MAG: YncE family protein, partial [SAR324 cluster bacterium]